MEDYYENLYKKGLAYCVSKIKLSGEEIVKDDGI